MFTVHGRPLLRGWLVHLSRIIELRRQRMHGVHHRNHGSCVLPAVGKWQDRLGRY
jgi:hypothetical protein